MTTWFVFVLNLNVKILTDWFCVCSVIILLVRTGPFRSNILQRFCRIKNAWWVPGTSPLWVECAESLVPVTEEGALSLSGCQFFKMGLSIPIPYSTVLFKRKLTLYFPLQFVIKDITLLAVHVYHVK